MPNKKWVAVGELIAGLVGLYALLQENIAHIVQGTYDPVDLWSRFTYQSNLIAVVALLASSYAFWKGKNWKHLDTFRGAATLYMVITGAVFATLVHSASPVVAIDNNIMHQVIPIAMVVSWLVHQPAQQIPWEGWRKWLIYPLAYAGYALIYFRITGDPIYAFLDPTDDGYSPVIRMIVTLTVAAALVAFALTRLPLRRHTLRV